MCTAIQQTFASTAATAAVLLLAGAGAQAQEVTGRVMVGDVERSYVMTVQPGAERRPLPVVVALHGAFMDGRDMRRAFGLDALAASEGFVAVYPNGLYRRWNDGRRQPWRRRAAVDDVAFLRRLALHLVESGVADWRRLYLVGASNGGMMAYRMACEAPGAFTAYAAIIANMPVQLARDCHPGQGVPMLIMNATNDPFIPWEGGRIGYGGGSGRLVSTEESLAFWQRNNGCEQSGQLRHLANKDQKDGSTVSAEQYNKCATGAPVVLFTVAGGGHMPPGVTLKVRPAIKRILGKGNRDVSAAEVSWKFFRRFPGEDQR